MALAANLVLLRYATSRNDPVGKLSPRAAVITTPARTRPVRTVTEPATTTVRTATRPTTTTDDHGGGRHGGGGDDD